MYADRIVVGSKRSIKERLYGNLDDDISSIRPASTKRQRPSDDKWKHDLYGNPNEPQTLQSKVGPKDLRLKLQKKTSQQGYQGAKASGVRDLREKLSGTSVLREKLAGTSDLREKLSGTSDLREKLSGTMNAQPPNTDLPKAKLVPGTVNHVEKSSPVKVHGPETKKTSVPTSSRKNSQQKSDVSADGFLKSLGLEKYLITLKAEEVDMAVLKHMTDKDLKTLGIPMGPRKKILLALESRA